MAALNEPTISAMTVGPSDSGGGLMTKLPQAVTQAVQPLVQQAGQQITGSVSSALGTGAGDIRPAITPRPGGMPTKGGIPRGMQPNLPNVRRLDQGPSNFSDPTHFNYIGPSPSILPDDIRGPVAAAMADGGLVPAAQAVQSQGRGDDKMLVHMTPGEVRGLQALAVANGGSLTINPQTGLPEAGFLSSILPLAAGFALGPAGFGLMSAGAAGLTVGGITALMTGDLGQGLMAGLGAFGGANLGSALADAGAAGVSGADAATKAAIMDAGGSATAAEMATANLGTAAAGGAGSQYAQLMAQNAGFGAEGLTSLADAANYASGVSGAAAAPSMSTLAMQGAKNLITSPTEGFSNLGGALADQWGNMGTMEKAATVGGALNTAAPLLEPEPLTFAEMPEGYEMKYAQPGPPPDRGYQQPSNEDILRGGREYSYFANTNPVPGYTFKDGDSVESKEKKEREELRENMSDFARYIYDKTGTNIDLQAIKKMMQMEGKADGGTVHMEDGGFVMDARSVSEMGNGSSSAGLERLAQIGAMPIRGAGDGVSDSIPATIDGNPIAAVAREEAYFSPDAVKRLGGGSIQRGSDKLYAMMDKANKARRKADRGDNSGLGQLIA